MGDVLGTAMLDFLKGRYTEDIQTFSSLGEEDVIPVPYLFRSFEDMPLLEHKALLLCYGKVLDIGCGAGPHSLYLQNQGLEVVGLDASAGAIEACQIQGLRETVHSSILDYSKATFDTLLLLMNGVGVVGKLHKLAHFLSHLKKLLHPKGQILLDSSDIIYMFEKDADGGYWVDGNTDYYGEVHFTMHYKTLKSRVFTWLYVDYTTMKTIAENEGFACELVSNGPHYDYLARLTLKA